MNHEGTKSIKMGQYRSLSPECEEVSRQVVDSAVKVHRELGPGLLESVYERCLQHELRKRGLEAARQVPVPVMYDGMTIEGGLTLDLIVNDIVVIELKAVEQIIPLYEAQLLRASLLIRTTGFQPVDLARCRLFRRAESPSYRQKPGISCI